MEASWETRWAQQEFAMQRLRSHIGLEPPSVTPDQTQGPGQSLSSPTSAIQQVDALPYSEQINLPLWHMAHAEAQRHMCSGTMAIMTYKITQPAQMYLTLCKLCIASHVQYAARLTASKHLSTGDGLQGCSVV